MGLLLLVASLWMLLQFSPIQSWLVRKASNYLSSELGTEVRVRHVDFSLFNRALIEGVLVRDLQKDTLLYAGRIGTKITDWFFVKNKITLKEISLEHVYVNLHRSDSTWNYQFLADYFSGGDQSASPKKSTKTYLLKKLQLRHIRLSQKDAWRGENLSLALDRLSMEPRNIDLSKGIFNLAKLELERPVFAIENYDGNRPAKEKKPDAFYHSDTSAISWNDGSVKLNIDRLLIRNGDFKSDIRGAGNAQQGFDGEHLHFKDIQARFADVVFVNDTVKANISATTIEKSGFEVKRLNALLHWHPKGMEFHQLDLETNESRLGNYFAMRYRDFNHDMSNFIDHVTMEGRFTNSKLSTNDLSFFAPELKNWNAIWQINGTATGTIDHLKGKNISIRSNQNTWLEGDLSLDGLPDIESTFIDLKAKRLQTSYAEAVRMIPQLKQVTQPDLSQLSNIRYTGVFQGKWNDFSLNGAFQSNLGKLSANLKLAMPHGKQPSYTGKFQTTAFELGRLFKEPSLSNVSMEASIKGSGFNYNTLRAAFNANIASFTYKQLTLTNIVSNGNIENKSIAGELSVDNPSLAMQMKGMADLSSDTGEYILNGLIAQADLRALGLSKKNLSFSAKLSADIAASGFDAFTGNAALESVAFISNGTPLSFDHLWVASSINNQGKLLEINSNEFDAQLKGNFNLKDLPNAATSFLHNYYPSYIATPAKPLIDQEFSYKITTREISPFVALFNIPISGFDYSSIEGQIDLDKNIIETSLSIPAFTIEDVRFSTLQLNAKGDFANLNLQCTVDEIDLTESFHLPKTEISISAAGDKSNIQLITSANQAINDARLNAVATTSQKGIEFKLQPSDIIFNNRSWQIQDAATVFVSADNLSIEDFALRSGQQQIVAYTHPSEITNTEDIVLDLRKLQMSDFLPYLFNDPRLEGSVTGRVNIINPFGKLQVEANLTTEQFIFNNDSIGLIKLKGVYNDATSAITYELESDNLYYNFDAKGFINLRDSSDAQMSHTIRLRNTRLSPLETYLDAILKDLKGTATGTIQLTGLRDSPDLTGSVRLRNASFLLDYTQCKYFLEETDLQLNKGEIDFGNMRLRDSTNRYARFGGKIYHRFFQNMGFDLNFKTENDQRGLLVLNTTKKDNSLFHGTVFARATGTLKGPLNNMILKISGTPTDSSKLSLITSDTRVTGSADYVVFRRYGKDMEVESDVNDVSSLLVDLDIIANPLASVDIVLDETTNDIVRGRGNGFLNIRVGTNESLTINGNYEITRGEYTFNWQSIIKKPFTIDKGSIVWNGDPYNAKINIEAKYTAREVYLPQQAIQGASNERGDIMIVGELTNTLLNPNIRFRFELPPGNPWRNNPLTMAGLKSIQDNPDEMNKQVASVLLFNGFIGAQQSTQGSSWLGANVASGVAGTVSQFLSQQLSSTLNNFVEKVLGLKNFDPYVTINPNLAMGFQANQGVLGTGTFGFTQRLLNGRIILKAGATYLAGAQNNAGNNQVLPDFSLEYFITPDGKLRLIGFYKNVFDIQWQRSNRAGTSLSYVKEFDLLNQIFTSRKKIDARQQNN